MSLPTKKESFKKSKNGASDFKENTRDERITDLHYAVQDGNLETVIALLNSGYHIDIKDQLDNTPLFYAVNEGNVKLVRFLIKQGASVNAQNKIKYTPLHVACEQGSQAIVELLLAKGAHKEIRDEQWGATPLICAAFWQNERVLQLLLEKGADVSGISSIFGYTALHLSAIRGNLPSVRSLIKHHAEINAQTHTGATSLLLAISNKHLDVSEFLLAKGAHVNITDVRGECPLYCAVSSGVLYSVNLLLGKDDIDSDMLTNLGDSAIHAACRGSNEKILEVLLRHSLFHINTQGKNNSTPLHLAVTGGNEGMVLLLKKYGAARDVKDDQQETAVDIAIRMDKLPIVKILGGKISKHMAHVYKDFNKAKTMNDAMKILRHNYPNIGGLQPVEISTDTPGDAFKITHPFVQIIKEENRYILVSTIGVKTGHVEYYDPASESPNIHENHTLKRMLANWTFSVNQGTKLYIHCIDVHHYFNCNQSGLLSLVIALCLIQQGCCSPEIRDMDCDLLRKQLSACIKNRTFKTGFFKGQSKILRRKSCFSPKHREPGASFKNDVAVVDLHCLCKSPYDQGMDECSKCKRHIHLSCVNQFDWSALSLSSKTSKSSSKCSIEQQLTSPPSEIRCPDCVYSLQHHLSPAAVKKPNIFDAFISYSYSDFAFVEKNIIPNLENSTNSKYPFKCMVEDRNMMAGTSIPHGIVDSISQSRKCIAVISHNYFKGHWTRFEWMHMYFQNWMNLAVILVDPYEELLQSGEAPPTLKALLENNHYMEWRDDFSIEESDKFWDRIRNYLEPPLSRQSRQFVLDGKAMLPARK